MPRLIDAKELEKKALTESCFDSQTEDVFLDLVDSMPTIDAEPVRHGTWKKRGKNLGECPYCGEVVAARHNFCPNCGAIMDGGGSRD